MLEISSILLIIWFTFKWHILRPFWQGQESQYTVLTDITNEKKSKKTSTKASSNPSEIWKWLERLDVGVVGLTYLTGFTEEVFDVTLREELLLLFLAKMLKPSLVIVKKCP